MTQQTTNVCKTPLRVTAVQVEPDSSDCGRPSIKDRLFKFCADRDIPRNQWLSYSIMTLTCLAGAMVVAPDKRLLESAICRKYYDRNAPGLYPPTTQIPEFQCKEGEIQASLASITSIMSIEASIIDLLVSVPMGRLADRKGFRLVMLVNLFFNICYCVSILVIGRYSAVLPLWLYYLAPLLSLPSGTGVVLNTLLFAVITKAVPSSKRTEAFASLFGFSWTALLIGPILGSTLMSINLSLPFLIAIALLLVAFIPVSFLLPSKAIDQRIVGISVGADVSDDPTQPLLTRELKQDETYKDDLDPPVKSQGSWFKFVKGFVLSNDKTLLFGMISQGFIGMSSTCKNFLLPYVSLRFSWTMAEAGYLLIVIAALSLSVYLFLLPMTTSLLSRRWGMTQFCTDVRISQLSIVLQSAGAFLIGVAPYPHILIIGLAINSLGTGAECSLRAAVSTLVDDEQAGQLFATFSLFDTLAISAGLPIMASAYSWASEKSRWMSGLPFVIAGSILLIALTTMLGMKVTQRL